MTQTVPTEHWEQAQLFQWAAYIPELRLMYAIPNGGHRAKHVAKLLKEEGVKAGVPDIFLPVPRGGKHGLYIELKRRKGGRVSPDQLAWLEALMRQGYACAVCKGWERARDVIMDYLQGEKENGQEGVYAGQPGEPNAQAGASAGESAV